MQQLVSSPRATSGALATAKKALVILLTVGATPDALNISCTEAMLSRGFDAQTIVAFLGGIQ